MYKSSKLSLLLWNVIGSRRELVMPLTFCKSPLTYVNMYELDFTVSCASLSFNFHDHEWTSSSVYFRPPLFGLPSSTEGHLCALHTTSQQPCATEGNPNIQRKSIWRVGRRGGKAAIPVICDTRSRTKWKLDAVTWIWLAPRRRSGYFIEFSTVSIRARTCSFLFLFFLRPIHIPSTNQSLICASVLVNLYRRSVSRA